MVFHGLHADAEQRADFLLALPLILAEKKHGPATISQPGIDNIRDMTFKYPQFKDVLGIIFFGRGDGRDLRFQFLPDRTVPGMIADNIPADAQGQREKGEVGLERRAVLPDAHKRFLHNIVGKVGFPDAEKHLAEDKGLKFPEQHPEGITV